MKKEDDENMIQKNETKKPGVHHVSDSTVNKAAAQQFNKFRETFRKLAKR